MKKFYINVIDDCSVHNILKPKSNEKIVGLFRECEIDQSGHCCGWYGAEYYLDTKMYAYFVTEEPEYSTAHVDAGNTKTCNHPIKYKKIGIKTHYLTRVIEAKSVEEAIVLFQDAKWRSWDSAQDKLKFHVVIKAKIVKFNMQLKYRISRFPEEIKDRIEKRRLSKKYQSRRRKEKRKEFEESKKYVPDSGGFK